MTAFEIAVQDAAGIDIAARVAPDRIELCAALSTGGITPSVALIERAAAAGCATHVLIRPRAGGFDYDEADSAVMLTDVRRAFEAGADGIVVGALRDGRVDEAFVREAVALAEGRDVTFHRAFDTLADPFSALDALVSLGVSRILTSGGASRAADGAGRLRSLVARAAGAVQIMAGGGVDATNVRAVIATGVDAVHASAKRTVVEEVPISLGSGTGAGRVGYETTDEALALALREAVRAV
jgi:copper homeostasis protein